MSETEPDLHQYGLHNPANPTLPPEDDFSIFIDTNVDFDSLFDSDLFDQQTPTPTAADTEKPAKQRKAKNPPKTAKPTRDGIL